MVGNRIAINSTDKIYVSNVNNSTQRIELLTAIYPH